MERNIPKESIPAPDVFLNDLDVDTSVDDEDLFKDHDSSLNDDLNDIDEIFDNMNINFASDSESTSNDDQSHFAQSLHGAVSSYDLPPRVVPNHRQQPDPARWTDGTNALEFDNAPAPIATSKLLDEENKHEIQQSRMATQGGRSMKKTSNRITRGMLERTTKAHDADPSRLVEILQQRTNENRFGDHRAVEPFSATVHTIRGVHEMDQEKIRSTIDPIALGVAHLTEMNNAKKDSELRQSRDELGTLLDSVDLDGEIDTLLKEIKTHVEVDQNQRNEPDNVQTTAPSQQTSFASMFDTGSSTGSNVPQASFASQAPAYSRSFYTDNETMESLNRAMRQMANNFQQNSQMDPLRERHNTYSGVFQPATNNYLEQLLMQAPQPTPAQKSWKITQGVMLRHGICLSRAVFDMYLCAPSRGQRACSAGPLCLASRLYGVQSMPPLREFDALNLMEQMGEPECTPEALHRCYEKRREQQASGIRGSASKAPCNLHQLCILCLFYNISTAHMRTLNSNTSLPTTSSSSTGESGTPCGMEEPEITLARIYVRIGPDQFSPQDCLFPSTTLYTGLLGPIPNITLYSFRDCEDMRDASQPRRLRYLGHKPESRESVGF